MIQEGLNRRPPLRREADSRAVVACLLRPAAVESDSDSELEVFYILRSVRPGEASRWAGQVAFPGGHVDTEESDHQAAARECLEEIGLELDAIGAFRFLGCVRERIVPRQSSTLAVACRVYLQLAPQELPLRPEPSEVAACGWAPLSVLLEEESVRPLQWSLHDPRDGKRWDGFPSVPLPMRDMTVAAGIQEDSIADKFILWGLTLSIVNDFLIASQLRTSPIDLKPLSGL